MRVMLGLIQEHDLEEELEDDMVDVTGNTLFYLGHDDWAGGVDEGSDGEDPEADAKQEVRQLRQEASDHQSLVEAVSGVLELRSITTDLERARMRLEDLRSLGLA